MQKIAFVIVALLTLCLCVVGFGTTSQQPKKADFSQLKVTLAIPQQQVLLLEPMPISLKITNVTKHAITAHTDISLTTSNFVRIFVGTNVKEMREIKDKSLLHFQKRVEPRDIEAGQSLEVKDFLTLKLDKYFPQSGEYKLQVEFANIGGATILSNVATVRVVEPQGIDRLAYDYIKQSGKADAFFTGIGVFDKDGKDLNDEFTNIFETSVYGDHALLLKAERKFASEDYDEAESLFEKVRKSGKPVLTHIASFYIERVKEKKAKPDIP